MSLPTFILKLHPPSELKKSDIPFVSANYAHPLLSRHQLQQNLELAKREELEAGDADKLPDPPQKSVAAVEDPLSGGMERMSIKSEER